MRKAALVSFLFSLAVPGLLAGDVARFLNLGFSDDSRYFMFGQYGISAATAKPFADGYIIDVSKNEFVPQGAWSEQFDVKPEPGNDGLGGMLNLLGKNQTLLNKYRINHLLSGRIVYVLIDGQTPISLLEFRDFSTGHLYTVKLTQKQKGGGAAVSSSFSIEVTVVFASGKKATYYIGHPDYARKGVKEYRIKYLLLAPDGASLVFVLEKSIVTGDGENIRYMVETKKINEK